MVIFVLLFTHDSSVLQLRVGNRDDLGLICHLCIKQML